MEFEIIRSNRKTMSLQVTQDCRVVVRAPYRMSERRIKAFVKEKEDWIIAHLDKMEQKKEALDALPPLSKDEVKSLARNAKMILPVKVKYYADLVGVDYGRITIRMQRTVWGSCSSSGNLNFNCLLMLLPEEIVDYVVVHELCHRLEMNHSKRFWAEVAKVMPDYKERRRWLKKQGDLVIRREVE